MLETAAGIEDAVRILVQDIKQTLIANPMVNNKPLLCCRYPGGDQTAY